MPIADKRYLVTGGTGSFGNFIVHRLLDAGAREVRVLSRDEKKQYDMRVFYGGRPELTTIIGDVRDRRVVMEATDGVDVVLQAAALKQVPTCERFPMEAVRTNVLGAENVVEAALAHKVESVVAISTDKAVKPVNAMGMTKALQERIVLGANQSKANHGTRFAVVRYGNVLRSRGSVVPFFRRQLARGERLTVTDERMTRFLLTLNDAIDLVLYATEEAAGGEIFVRKAPSARVLDIAAVLSEEAGRPLDYETIGILAGEKLAEILISEEELRRTEDHGEYLRVHPFWEPADRADLVAEYSSATELVDRDVLRTLIAASDAEFESMEMVGGEFARF
jgi:UDP-N-acetylglucosamine 4,6-dehydratase/5-epimerase